MYCKREQRSFLGLVDVFAAYEISFGLSSYDRASSMLRALELAEVPPDLSFILYIYFKNIWIKIVMCNASRRRLVVNILLLHFLFTAIKHISHLDPPPHCHI
jgi:hypothetical protein